MREADKYERLASYTARKSLNIISDDEASVGQATRPTTPSILNAKNMSLAVFWEVDKSVSVLGMGISNDPMLWRVIGLLETAFV